MMSGGVTYRRDNSLMPSRVLIVCDATKDRSNHELRHTIQSIRTHGGIVHSGDRITVLGVMDRVLHPMGYQMRVAPENFLGTTHIRAMREEVSKKVDLYVSMLQGSAEECEGDGVSVEVNIVAGTPMKRVVVQEVAKSNPTWVILDRHLRGELRFYLRNTACKVALVLDNLSLEVLRSLSSNKEIERFEHQLFYSECKPVPLLSVHDNNNNEQDIISLSYSASMTSIESSDMAKALMASLRSNSKENTFSSKDENRSNLKLEKSGGQPKGETKYNFWQRSSEGPLLCITCGIKTELDARRYSYSEIQLATENFSSDNLLGEGVFGLVYKGKLNGSQRIAAKVRKEASTQGFAEFHSEIYVLSLARHKNIVMLLGYCCKENLNILVYEYICNKSLEWHLFDNTGYVLEWHRRYTIALGTAKGLRFLHEECRGSPIIHRDMRPGNILLTHDFVPMLGDFGLAKWTTNEDDIQTRLLGCHGYLAPEYVENGIVSVRTDVYAFGIVLIQLISGRKAVDSTKEGQQLSVRQWAFPLMETLALDKLVDSRLGDSYNTCELYHMARTAYLCIQHEPEMRPSMAEVLRLLEGENDHFQHLTEQFIPHYSK